MIQFPNPADLPQTYPVYCTVIFDSYRLSDDQVHEIAEYTLGCQNQTARVKVVRDLTSDVCSYEGADALRFNIGGMDFTAAQVVRMALPLAPHEAKIVDSVHVTSLRSYLGPQAWAELLSLQPPMATINKEKYGTNYNPSLSLDASDWVDRD